MKKFILGAVCLISASAFAATLEVKYQDKAVIEMKDIASATAVEGADKNWNLSLKLTRKGSKKFAKETKKLIGKKLDILLDGQTLSSPTVQDAINSGTIVVALNTTKEAAMETASNINDELKEKK